MTDRKEGWYWIRDIRRGYQEPEIGRYVNGVWWVPCEIAGLPDSDVEVLSERLEPPKEKA